MTRRVVLCRAEEISEGVARSFIIGEGLNRVDILLVRRNGVLRAYLNSCPHEGTPLETFPDKFLDENGSLLVCSTHGARFLVETGCCVSGPCEGLRLSSVAYDVEAGEISVHL